MMTPEPVPMHAGSVIDYSLRIHGIPVHWRTMIIDYDPPNGFVDFQLNGPYQLWHHQHRFRARDGGTEIEDVIHYSMPFGPVGDLMNRLLVRRDIRRIFGFRRHRISEIFKRATT